MTQAAENGWSKAEREVMARLRGIEAAQRETTKAIGEMNVTLGRMDLRIDQHRHADQEDDIRELRDLARADLPGRRLRDKVVTAFINAIVPAIVAGGLVLLAAGR